MEHTPVMVQPVAEYLLTNADGFYVDATLGTGGHTESILRAGGKHIKVIGIDRDRSAVQKAKERLKPFGSMVMFVCGNFRNIEKLIPERKYDGFLLDLGLSSYQLADRSRGFSYMDDGPLDMSMGEDGRSVRELLATATAKEIERILRTNGEVRRYRPIAGEIVKLRQRAEITRTFQLRSAVEKAVPVNGLIGVLSRVFQAFRIWANQELECLREFLPKALDMLSPGGRMVVISYHSLEDRIVKRFFRQEEKGCVCPDDLPACCCGRISRLRVMTRRPVVPSPEETEENKRSRSAKLRAVERV